MLSTPQFRVRDPSPELETVVWNFGIKDYFIIGGAYLLNGAAGYRYGAPFPPPRRRPAAPPARSPRAAGGRVRVPTAGTMAMLGGAAPPRPFAPFAPSARAGARAQASLGSCTAMRRRATS